MLTLEKTSALPYNVLNESIKETFTAIDRFEWQALEEILQMREKQLYREAGHKSFEQYCQAELAAWGGYRRINQLLGAKEVIDAADELGEHIKNERQARSRMRLVKEPEKLKAAVAIALKDNPSPSESDFAAAANKVVPRLLRKKPVVEEPLVPEIQEPMVPQQTPAEGDPCDCALVIGLGSIVAHADTYSALYVQKGKVIEDLGDEVVVAWEHWQDKPKKTDRYFKDDLRFWQETNQ
ncbi:hypothetical protein A6770_33435 [Nostoc minutum NIES-26]|uniref:Uncharacterized protein n=1 Tax=Nostoc minutum NIES-26 TaxID=1844469 RepID=A0A367Q3R9_9NOSO|nr:hypothetical protein A6770_33435 [Nostoc minutum NIES-26]